MNVSDPTLTRHEPYGRITVQWPDPPRPSYDVSHEVIEQWVDTLNRIADLRCYLDGGKRVSSAVALRILDGAS